MKAVEREADKGHYSTDAALVRKIRELKGPAG
jgi:hypothetical protein